MLYDRHYSDFINDGRRSNINLPARLTRALCAFVNKPRLNFFLYADPQQILRWKREFSANTITQVTQQYKRCLGSSEPATGVPATCPSKIRPRTPPWS